MFKYAGHFFSPTPEDQVADWYLNELEEQNVTGVTIDSVERVEGQGQWLVHFHTDAPIDIDSTELDIWEEE